MSFYENKYDKFNKIKVCNEDWQKRCLEEISNFNNVILSAPTGSGKTRVYMEWAKLKNNKPVFITAPIKALSNQRYRELAEQGFVVGIETGDIKNVPDNCDFICCTQEIYTNKYMDEENATVVMDEFHYIFENSNRARTYIDALNKSKAKNIIICSATLGNIELFKKYVEKVSNRKFKNFETNSRLTSLFYKGDILLEDIRDSLVVAFSKQNIEYIVDELINVRRFQGKEVSSKIRALANEKKIKNRELISNANYGVAGYYGSLLPKEKMFIEECFERKLIDTVVGTDALALGVNFPVQNVVFAQLAKLYEGPISKNMFDQLSGRAGRKGYYDNGYVYYCEELGEALESSDFVTKKLYDKLLKSPNEELSIELTPDIKGILTGTTTPKEEAKYITKYSTNDGINKDNIAIDLKYTEDYIKHKAFKREVERIISENLVSDDYYKLDEFEKNKKITQIRTKCMEKEQEFCANIGKVYFDEFTPEMNCSVFTEILCNVNPNKILERYANPRDFYQMLEFRKYVKGLPKKYKKGLTRINNMVRDIDSTAIDGFGFVDFSEIGQELKEEGKLAGENLMHVLQKQKTAKKMKEDAELIDEQLKIAKKYRIKEYE